MSEKSIAMADASTLLRVRKLAGRLAGVEGVRAIKRLQHAWGHYAEAGDYAAMADLFAPDARLILSPREARGRDEILALLVETMGTGDASAAPDRLNVRLQLSPVVTISEDGRSGNARWHELTLSGRYGQRAEWAGGIHENEYVLVDGVWRISMLHHHPQFAGAHEDGWRNVSDAVPLVPFHFTPDQAGTPVPADLDVDVAPEAAALDLLTARARRLVEESLVQNLLSAYGYYVDRKLWDDVGDLFTDDGVLSWGDDEWLGRPGIRLGLESRSPAGLRHGEFFDHLQLMPIVDVSADGRTAHVRAVELQMIAMHGERGWWGVRVCEGDFVRTDDGWRIASLRFLPRLLADHAYGWGHSIPPRPAIGTAYPESRGPAITFPHPVRDPRPAMVADAGSSVDELRERVAVAAAFDGAENVACAYGYFLDEAHWDECADLFARDGFKELSFIGTYIGRERIRDSLVARYGRRPRRPTFLPIHQKTQPHATVDEGGQRVRIRLKMLQVNSAWDTEASTIAGVYEEQIVLEDGVWRIHGMDLEYVAVADWVAGLAGATPDLGRRFAPTPEAIATFDPAPDAPLRGLAFAPFPEIGPLGFHFANPVSGREPAIRLEWSDGRFDMSTFYEPVRTPERDTTRKVRI